MSDDGDTTIVNALMPTAVPKFLPTFRLQWEDAQNCYVVLYPEGMVKLNQSAGAILKRCDGKNTIADIAADLAAEFDSSKEQMLQDASNFISHAMQRGWIGV